MGVRGNVFDIQRGAMHDGPGLRTAVFLKGCHPNCAWCHNPEARAFERQLFFYHDKCVQCGLCVNACDYGVHRIEEEVHHIAFEQCALSGRCIEVCPHRALKIVGNDTAVEDVLSEVLADRHFYELSGGGITVTGGEPMAQFNFTRELLARCKEAGIHTCLETAGCVAARRFEEILPLVDLFLYDYKLADSAAHERRIHDPSNGAGICSS